MARERLQNQVQWSLTLGLPLVFGLFGLWRWQVRTARRNTPIRSASRSGKERDSSETEAKKAA